LQVRDALISAGRVSDISLKGLAEERKPVFAGGVAVLRAVFETLGIDHLQVSEYALREGLVYDLMGRSQHEDVRERTVASLSRQFQIDQDHAQRVRGTALILLRRLARPWAIQDPQQALMLGWAARLHEIGVMVAHSQYQKHGAYLLRNADLAGFTRSEQALLATLVLGHRRRFPTQELSALPHGLGGPARRLCVILRLAVLLHRSRSPISKPNPILSAAGDQLGLSFPDTWLDEHPLTRLELEEEAKRLAAAGIRIEFG
jgi:exopolyphosphatase/guanosine-5'-triphosphate,3'-diphosphate pyrophosphatase